jgi:hypothetical protein
MTAIMTTGLTAGLWPSPLAAGPYRPSLSRSGLR